MSDWNLILQMSFLLYVLLSLLAVLTFPLLKFFGVIEWSWWWIASPLLPGVAMVLAVGVMLTWRDMGPRDRKGACLHCSSS